MSLRLSVKDQSWFKDDGLHELFKILNHDGEEVRIAGGAVRDALMNLDIGDIDLATTWLPEDVKRLAEDAGFKVVPTGIEHGTLTLVKDGGVFEITTLREDISTNGRHAEVKFGKDWQKDAERRDLTVNGMYVNSEGDVIDLVGGVTDIESKVIRFIGDAQTRIEEDYLRVLRFFRFFAFYGEGRPDAEGLKACAKARDHLSSLSAERVWKEMRRLLEAKDPSRALLWMRTTGVLTEIFPETEKWGIDLVGPFVETREALGWESDPMLLLEGMIPPDGDRVAELTKRLRMSRAEAGRLLDWTKTPKVAHDLAETALDRALYRGSVQGYKDVLQLSLITARSKAGVNDDAMLEAAGFSKLLKRLDVWKKPNFPISGKDLMEKGYEAGTQLGGKLRELEDKWIESNFLIEREDLLKQI
ncbi:CCA tRNA nucleotidyltransferase [Lentilitoribacter sp. Alg239-R112]|jgi:poly(A) polymerase|uniref:CCA tRNA nucleotidyltransferase n=1 Tax=Lentilitoribacter sp. Alg239-R112 TaxID=2305987 RepID=UPI0013A700EC|nr:CCA tRNA nucleotidyltransferase [Lentilitoribacter sp. Alg239-R112]